MKAIRTITFALGIAGLTLGICSAWAQDGPLKIAADVGYAPFAMEKPEGGYEGLSIDMAEDIAKRLGRPRAEVIDTEWSGIFAGLFANRYEAIILPVITAERAERMLFAEGYLDTGLGFLVKKGNEINALEDLKGKNVAVNSGSISDTWATENEKKYGFIVQRYGKNADAVQAVLTGRAYACIAEVAVVGYAAVKQPALAMGYNLSTGGVFSIAFRPGDVELRNKVDEALECMKFDGTLAKFHEKWFASPPPDTSVMRKVYIGHGQPGFKGYEPDTHIPVCK